jgi:hypothetical protein
VEWVLHFSIARWYIFKAKISLWVNFGRFSIEYVGILYGQCDYYMAKWYILWPLGTFCCHLMYFSHFGMLHREKSGNPASLLFLLRRGFLEIGDTNTQI